MKFLIFNTSRLSLAQGSGTTYFFNGVVAPLSLNPRSSSTVASTTNSIISFSSTSLRSNVTLIVFTNYLADNLHPWEFIIILIRLFCLLLRLGRLASSSTSSACCSTSTAATVGPYPLPRHSTPRPWPVYWYSVFFMPSFHYLLRR